MKNSPNQLTKFSGLEDEGHEHFSVFEISFSVGSPQVPFLMCTLEIPQNCSTSSLLLTLVTFTFEPFLKL